MLMQTGEPPHLILRYGYDFVVVDVQVLGATGAKTPGYGLRDAGVRSLCSAGRTTPTLTCHSFMYLISPFVIFWKPHP